MKATTARERNAVIADALDSAANAARLIDTIDMRHCSRDLRRLLSAAHEQIASGAKDLRDALRTNLSSTKDKA